MPFEFQTSHGMVTPHKKVRIQNMFKHPKCLFKHLRKLDGNMGTVNKSLKKRTAITRITRTFTRNKFPRPNLSQGSVHVFAQLAIKSTIILQNLQNI